MLRLLPPLVALGWLLWSGIAIAAPGEVTVALELDGVAETPGWVCVASRGRGPAQVSSASLVALLGTEPVGEVPPSRVAEVVARFGGPGQDDEDPEEAALRAMVPGASEPSCGRRDHGRSHCAAAIDPAALEGRSFTCTVNERENGRMPRVLWLELSARDTRGAAAYVADLSLNGSVLTITTNLRGTGAVKVVKTIGGHYQEGAEVRSDDDELAVLRLEPRCRWLALAVPPIRLPAGGEQDRPKFVLEDEGRRAPVAPECVRGSLRDGSLEVRLPRNQRSSPLDRDDRGMRLVATIEQQVPRDDPWLGTSTSGIEADDEAPADAAPVASGWPVADPSWPPPRRRRRNVAVIQQAEDPSETTADRPDTEPPRAGGRAVAMADRLDVRLSARWSTAWPSTPVVLDARVVTFFWPRDECFYAQGCPEARLTGSVDTCDALERNDGCYYRCDVGQTKVGIVGDAFTVPIELADASHGTPRPEWGASLGHLNQRFGRSMPSSERRVRVDLDEWRWEDFVVLTTGRQPRWMRRAPVVYDTPSPTIAVPGDRIDALVFRSSAGSQHRIELRDPWRSEYFIDLPQARCGETVEVSIEGQREYRRAAVSLRGGELRLRHPMESARALYFGTGLTLGFTRALSPADVRRAVPWSPALAVDLSLRFRFRRKLRSWRFELPRFAYMLSTQPYFPLSEREGEFDAGGDRRAYGRFMLGAVARSREWELVPGIELGAAFGVMGSVGAPLLAKHVPFVGALDPGLVPMAEALVRISRRFEVRLTPQLICLESFHRHTTDLQGEATEIVDRGRMCTAFLGVGVAATW